MESILREKLLKMVEEYERLAQAMGTQEIAADPEAYRKHAKAHKDLAALVTCFTRYQDHEKALTEAEQILQDESDSELLEMAEDERNHLRPALTELEQELKVLLLPQDPNDDKNTIVEIRAGTGGDEAALFAADLYRMYQRYAELKGWKLDIMNSNPTELGGFKEISFQINGEKVFSQLKWEGGVHRVQRVPNTETQGRVHTSAVTVAVLPEADEVELHLEMSELQFDVYRSSGPGGQSVNTTDSAVRITHKPSGLIVTCQDEKSQHKNKAKALKVLRARLLDIKQHEEADARSEDRRSQVGSGDRSEKIRTYNFPENRLTDHRINLSLYRLKLAMEGDIQQMIDALTAADRTAKLTDNQ
jgi:peptide chain release factor 1